MGELETKALLFATEKHEGQTRKDRARTPYIEHPKTVLAILKLHGVKDDVVLAAALLHDTLEDTDTTHRELELRFGRKVADIVSEVSDDKSFSKDLRKKAQVEEASSLSEGAKSVRLADKLANIFDVIHAPPVGWCQSRRNEYIEWSTKIAVEVRGVVPTMDDFFDLVIFAHKHGVLPAKIETAYAMRLLVRSLNLLTPAISTAKVTDLFLVAEYLEQCPQKVEEAIEGAHMRSTHKVWETIKSDLAKYSAERIMPAF